MQITKEYLLNQKAGVEQERARAFDLIKAADGAISVINLMLRDLEQVEDGEKRDGA